MAAPHAERIAAALVDGEGCTPASVAGRGTVMRFDYGGGHGMVRHCERGGAMRRLIEDAYVLVNRPLREFRVHRHLAKAGLAVPPILGVCWRRRGMLVQGAVATEAAPGENLDLFLRREAADAPETLQRCGALVRAMHDLGAWHADLQVRNVLVGETGMWLIDFDKATLHRHVSKIQRMRNLLRFRRSLEKNDFPETFFAHLCAGYGAVPPAWLDSIYRLKGRISDLGRRQ